MFILARLTLPLAAFTAFSSTGVSCLHGPHQGAQKSTSTGWRFDSSMTSFMKACVVVSLTRSAVAAPPSCSIVIGFSNSAKCPVPCRINWLSGRRMQRRCAASLRFVRRAGHRLDAWVVAGPAQELDEVVARDRGRHAVVERMIVERLLPHHRDVEHDGD